FLQVRLQGFDCPEIFHPLNDVELARGLKAKARVEELLLGKAVVLRPQRGHITYGRFVSSVQYVAADGETLVSLAETLAAEGFAK
ncbi:MAG TPA: thermonuclease family protein, partial [Gemmatimonadales bacterium]|nr:thermonuclease family protein [Gemmatimonadales bacterium]